MNDLDLDFAATAKPFAAVIFCCTGVDHEERSVLVNHAQQMGAIFKADLRSDVTHMVVGNVNTPKYVFAAHSRFDLRIMDLTWIQEAYEKWIQGEDVHFDEITSSHILPPLSGLNICLTNIASQEERKLIEHRIRSHGGNYHPDLSRQCTHLLCASPTGKKYEAALKWGIQCVDVQWLFQSIDRGMSLEGKYFALDIDPERRGEGAWDSNAANQSSTFSGLIPPTNDTSTGEFDNGTRKRRLRRAGSKIAQEGIWEGILGGVTDTQTSTLHIPESISTTRVPNGIDLPKSIPEEPAHEGFNMDIDTPAGLFDGMIFYTWGFTDKKRGVLADVITKNSGLIFTKPASGSAQQFTVIPYTVPREEAPPGYGGSEVVTEMWIERCITANRTFDPNDMAMCTPILGPFPRPYLQDIAISITGFSGVDLLHVEKLITLLGAHYYDNLTRKRSLLLIPDKEMNGPKVLKAREWGIPIVHVSWLWEVISRGSDEIDINSWSDNPSDLVRYTPTEASTGPKPHGGKDSSCPPVVGTGTRSILDGCVIYISKKLEGLAPELQTIAEHLGARVAKKFDVERVTHLIHQSSKVSETFREFRLARSASIHIVHPQWLFQCRSRGTRCGEETWGWMWNAEKSLSIIGSAEPNTAPPEVRREKRQRQDENTPPDQPSYVADPVKLEQLTKLLGTVSSPQKKTKRRLAGRARTTQMSTTTSSVPSPEAVFTKNSEEEGEEDAPRPTQERVAYKDPVAEREMAKIVANLRGIADDGRDAQLKNSGMTPAEDIGRRARRKSSRK